MKNIANIVPRLLPLAAFLMIAGAWELLVTWKDVPPWLLPAPSRIISALIQSFPAIMEHSSATLLEAGAGLAISICLAYMLASLMDLFKPLDQTLYPLFVVSQTIPLIILAVLFTVWFGWGLTPKVLIVILVCFFPLVINLRQGMEDVDPDLIDLLRSMGASKQQILHRVRLPSSLPAFFSGLRIAASYSIMTAVIAELMGSEKGLGFYILITQKSFQIDRVLAAVVWICFLSYMLVRIVDWTEKLVIPWRNLRIE